MDGDFSETTARPAVRQTGEPAKRETEMETQELENVPQTFTRDSIVKLLHSKSIVGVIDSYRLASLLGTISQRMIRNYTKDGQLKPIDGTATYYVYKVEAVADWLLKYPQYLFKTRSDTSLTMERINELTELTKNYVRKSWKGLLTKMELEDIVSEVILRIMRMKRRNANDATLIYRSLYAIWKKTKREVEIDREINVEDLDVDDDQ
jgi:hypothetical protein